MKGWKRFLSLLLGLCMLFQTIGMTAVAAKEEEPEEYTTTISHKQQSGETNFFKFADGKWEAGNDTHTWSKPVDTAKPGDTYYEVTFNGHKIDVYAGKNYMMGKVKCIVDGKDCGEFSLYNPQNINSTKITTIDELTEGQHKLRVEATGERDAAGKGALQIDAAQVVVYHNRYAITEITPEESTLTLTEGAEHELAFDVKPSYASKEDVTITSSDKDIVEVTEDGKLLAEKVGEATITLASEKDGKSATVKVKVTEGDRELGGTIVDSNLQYPTADKYETVKSMSQRTSETLSAWKNDTAVSQISLYTKDVRVKNVSVEVSDFKAEDGKTIDKKNVEAIFIKSVQAYTGMPGYGDPSRPVPEGNRKEANEVLYQTTPIDIPSKSLQNIWLSINVPKDAKAGTYTGTVSVKAEGVEKELKFEYTLKVADATLADATEFKDGFDMELWQNPYRVAEYYDVKPFSKEHFDILKPHMEKYKSVGGHAITTTIVDDAWAGQTYGEGTIKYQSMIKWIKEKDGSFTFDYTDFDAWIKFNKDLGIGDKIICYSIAPWNNQVTYFDKGQNKNITTPLKVGEATWTNMWTIFFTDLMKHMEEKGWKDETYIGIDERGMDMRAFDLLDKILGEDGKPFLTAGAMDHIDSKHDLAMRIDDLNVGSMAIKSHKSTFDKLVAEREVAGMRTTVYTCTGHQPGNFSLSAPGESYWTMMYSYSVGGQGYLRWAYDSWVADPLKDTTHNAFEAGDCFLIFSDEKDTKNPQPKSSLRLEKMAEGVRDVNKLMQMKKEVTAMGDEVDALMKTIKASYAVSGYYLTEDGKTALANDMKVVKEGIAELTEKYVDYKENGTTEVKSITIEQGVKADVTLGTTLQLKANLQPETLLDKDVTWKSEKPTIATVSKDGLVTTKKTGVTKITATSVQDTDKKAEIEITVKAVEVDAKAQKYYYTFEDNKVEDKWGDRDGTISGATFANGKSGKALKIADEQKVTFTENKELKDTWTVGYWIYNTGTTSGRNSVLTSTDSVWSFDNSIAADNVKAGVHVKSGNGGYLTFPYNVPTGKWVHLTWTNDKTNGLSLYANGQLIQTNNWTKSNDFIAPIDVIGGEGFTGMIDELKVYNGALNAAEVQASMKVEGLNITETDVNMYVGETHEIITDLVSDSTDKKITYQSDNEKVATVNDEGIVTAHKKGTAVITVKGGGFTEKVTVHVQKKLEIRYTIPQYVLPEANLSDIDKPTDKNSQYLGQPDMVALKDNKTLITAYPQGHGCGSLVMQVSIDAGETWTKKTDIPAGWKNSLETPTMYRLDMTDGSEKLVLITGRPNWHKNTKGGWDMSVSDDGGKTWSEPVTYQSKRSNGEGGEEENFSTVAMASLVQLKDKDGKFIDKWMGVYHDSNTFVNYKSYLTFDKDGAPQWSYPEPYLSEYRSIESAAQMCEIGMFRSPDGERIVALARSQSHKHKSLIFYSDDEGETWSKPEELQGALQGERHKAVYDPISGRLLITFREITLDYNKNGVIEDGDWMAGDWIAWVGTYDDLMKQNEGQYRILLDEDWAKSAKSGDTGYTGLVVLPDGTFVMDSYGHWDKEYSENWTGGVTTDLCYIRQAKFTLGEIDLRAGLVDKTALGEAIEKYGNVDDSKYTEDSYAAYKEVFENAKAVYESRKVQQIQVDDAVKALEDAYKGLTQNKPVDPENPELEKARKALETKLAEAKGIDQNLYTEETSRAFQKAIDNAEAVLADEKASLEALNGAFNGLVSAMDRLEEKGDPNPNPDPKPDTKPDPKPDSKPDKDPQKPSKGDSGKIPVKTGDATSAGAWGILVVVSVVLAVGISQRKRFTKK